MAKLGWIACVEILGWTLLVLGIAMLVLPGPGIVGVFLGLVVLSQRYTWAHKLKEASKDKVRESARISVETRTRVFFSISSALLIMGLGVLVAKDPRVPQELHFELLGLEVGPYIPGAGVVSGTIMVFSAAIALSVVLGAWWNFRHENRAKRKMSRDG